MFVVYWQTFKCSDDGLYKNEDPSSLCHYTSPTVWNSYLTDRFDIYKTHVAPVFILDKQNYDDTSIFKTEKPILVKIRDAILHYVYYPVSLTVQHVSEKYIDWDYIHALEKDVIYHLKLYYLIYINPRVTIIKNYFKKYDFVLEDIKTRINYQQNLNIFLNLVDYFFALINSLFFKIKMKLSGINNDFIIDRNVLNTSSFSLNTVSSSLDIESTTLSDSIPTTIITATTTSTYVTTATSLVLASASDNNTKNENDLIKQSDSHSNNNLKIISNDNDIEDLPMNQDEIQEEFDAWFNAIDRKSNQIFNYYTKSIDSLINSEINDAEPNLSQKLTNLTNIARKQINLLIKNIDYINCSIEINNTTGEVLIFDKKNETQLIDYITRPKLNSLFDTTKIIIQNLINDINIDLLDLVKNIQKKIISTHEEHLEVFEEWGDIMVSEWSKRMAYLDVMNSHFEALNAINIQNNIEGSDDDDEINNLNENFYNNWSKFVSLKRQVIQTRDNLANYQVNLQIMEDFLNIYQDKLEILINETKEFIHILRARANIMFEKREREENEKELEALQNDIALKEFERKKKFEEYQEKNLENQYKDGLNSRQTDQKLREDKINQNLKQQEKEILSQKKREIARKERIAREERRRKDNEERLLEERLKSLAEEEKYKNDHEQRLKEQRKSYIAKKSSFAASLKSESLKSKQQQEAKENNNMINSNDIKTDSDNKGSLESTLTSSLGLSSTTAILTQSSNVQEVNIDRDIADIQIDTASVIPDVQIDSQSEITSTIEETSIQTESQVASSTIEETPIQTESVVASSTAISETEIEILTTIIETKTITSTSIEDITDTIDLETDEEEEIPTETSTSTITRTQVISKSHIPAKTDKVEEENKNNEEMINEIIKQKEIQQNLQETVEQQDIQEAVEKQETEEHIEI